MESVTVNGAPAVVPQEAPAGTTAETKGKITTATATTPPVVEAPKTEERPTWLPEKFKTVEAFVASHKELEAKLGAPKTTEEKVVTPPVVDDSAKAVAEKGIDMDALTTEFTANNGALKPETLEKLKATGLSEATVSAYIEGQKARAAAYTSEIAAVVGGPEKMQQMFEWAGKNMTADEVIAFNKTMSSFDKASATLALKGLQADYVAKMGSDPSLVNGSSVAQTSGVQPYGSSAELMKDMSDKRYKNNDTAFHKMVRDRLDKTNMFGFQSA